MPSSGVQTCALDRKSTRLNSSHTIISYAVFCLKKKINLELDLAVQRPTQSTRREIVCDVGCQIGKLQLCFFFFKDTATPEIYPLSPPDALPINDTATTEIYPLSLHDALPISVVAVSFESPDEDADPPRSGRTCPCRPTTCF